MSFSAQAFRILIASPSDVAEERDIAVRAIQEWNDLNAAERQIVLLPLRWETHSSPEYGKRPQEVINRQVVDHCDLLVGIFWTRVGTPTGVSEGGTIEEIERVASDGKPVMLYFSQAKHDLDRLDLDQLSKLREFKKKTFPKALIENYSGAIEFKEKLSKQIEIQLRTLLAERSERGGASSIRPLTDILMHFADPENGFDMGDSAVVSTKNIVVNDFDRIPDYAPLSNTANIKAGREQGASNWLLGVKDADVNKHYYRQRVTSIVLKEFFRPVRFWLKNQGGVGGRDVYIDISVSASKANVVLIPKRQLPEVAPSKSSSSFAMFGAAPFPISPAVLTTKVASGWRTQLEVSALQPQRELSPLPEFYIGATESCDVVISAKIYADTLSEPVVQELSLRINVESHVASAEQILDEIVLPADQAALGDFAMGHLPAL